MSSRTEYSRYPRYSTRAFLARLTLALLSSAALAPSLVAERPPGPRDPETARRNRERWKRLDAEKRKQLTKLFRSMPPETREELLRRLRSLAPEKRRSAIRRARERLRAPPEERQVERVRRRLQRQAWERLPREERERLRGLAPRARRDYMRKRIHRRREDLLRRLPTEVRDGARKLPPEDQARFLRLRLATEAARRTFPDAGEVRRIRSLRRDRVAALLLPHPRRRPPPRRPPFLSPETWERWRRLKPYEKPRVLRLVLDGRPWPPEPLDLRRFRAGRRMGPPLDRPRRRLEPPSGSRPSRQRSRVRDAREPPRTREPPGPPFRRPAAPRGDRRRNGEAPTRDRLPKAEAPHD